MNLCTDGNLQSLSCAIRYDITDRLVVASNHVSALSSSVGVSNSVATKTFIQSNILGVSDFANDTASNFVDLARLKFGIDDRIHRGWVVSPGYNWVAPGGASQSLLTLSDKTILIGVVTLNNGAGTVLRRRLLTFNTGMVFWFLTCSL